MSVDLSIEAGGWPDWVEGKTLDLARFLFANFDIDENAAEFSVLLSDDKTIAQLNAKYRGKEKATNVLSWPAEDFPRELGAHPKIPQFAPHPFAHSLGDLAFAFETCQQEASAKGLEAHYSHLLIHGFLHLLGYDHVEAADANIMEGLEITLLDRLNIENPYD